MQSRCARFCKSEEVWRKKLSLLPARHNAYARVKDHCKRHGTPCVHLDKPGAGVFARALGAAGASAGG